MKEEFDIRMNEKEIEWEQIEWDLFCLYARDCKKNFDMKEEEKN